VLSEKAFAGAGFGGVVAADDDDDVSIFDSF